MGSLVDYTTERGVARLTLTDPPVNAYTHEMLRELDAAILEARFDSDVHVIVVTGHGDKYFCAGANVDMLRESDPTFKYYFSLHAGETLQRLEATPKLVIAAINGHCVGGGLEIALACDLRVAREGAYTLGLPEVSLGLLPGTGGTQRLARVIGRARALEMMCEGTTVGLAEAATIGILNKVWSADSAEDFNRRVMAYAHTFTPPNKASLAVGRIKRAVVSGMDMPLGEGLALERELQAELFASGDAAIGLDAFRDKKKPSFRGR